MKDVMIIDHGSLVQFHCKTEEAKNWWKENVQESFNKDNYTCETRYALDIYCCMNNAGLTTQLLRAL